MNYPFMESLNNFWVDETTTSRDFMYAMNRVYSLYPEQVNRAIFNFLDTHDTLRARNRCGSLDALYQQLTVLMTMPGTACIYYGTEIAMPGGHDPDCRRTMPWLAIEKGLYDEQIGDMKALIALRKDNPETRGADIAWRHNPNHPRLICYDRPGEKVSVRVYLNGGREAAEVKTEGKVLYSRKCTGGKIAPGGILVQRI